MPPTSAELSAQLTQLRTDKDQLERRIQALASEVLIAKDKEHQQEVLKISLEMLNNCGGRENREHTWTPVEFKRDIDCEFDRGGFDPGFPGFRMRRFPVAIQSVKLVCTGCGTTAAVSDPR